MLVMLLRVVMPCCVCSGVISVFDLCKHNDYASEHT